MERYFIQSNLRRFHAMKMISLVCLLIVFGPLFCEENSLVGCRMYWKDSKAGIFHSARGPEIRVIMYTLVCVLGILHMFITWRMRRNKRVLCGHFNNDLLNSLRERVYNSREFKTEVTMSLKRGENFTPLRVVQGILVHLKDCKLELLIWFILHDMLRVDIRACKILSFKLGPIFTVEEILASTTDDFKPLKEFILKGCGKREKSKPAVKYKRSLTKKRPVKQKRSKAKNVPKPKERVEDMTEMVTSMFAPCHTKRQFDNGCESFLYPKIKRLTETSKKPLCLPTGGYEKALKNTFEEESEIYSSKIPEDAQQTVKAHFMMAGGFASDFRRLSDQEQARKEKERESVALQKKVRTGWLGQDGIVVRQMIGSAEETQDTQESEIFKYFCKLPIPACSLGEVQAKGVFSNVESEVESHRPWEYEDYAHVAVGCGTVAFALFSVYRIFRG